MKRFFLFLFSLASVSAWSQTNVPAKWNEKDLANEKLLREEVYVHTDKDFYVAGDIIWFRVYYAEAGTHRPLQFSKIAYVELLDRNNKPAVQAKISLANGGDGSLYLPPALSTGNYILRAYTSWMKNFGAADFFEKKITVVNTLRNEAGSTTIDTVRTIAAFFPEGGDLVEGIQTHIGFQVTDNQGKGLDAKGIIVSEQNDTLLNFTTRRFGRGSFLFTPEGGRKYYAVVTADGRTIRRELGPVKKQGYVMNLLREAGGNYNVTLASNSGKGSTDLRLVVHAGNEVRIAETLRLADNSPAVVAIDPSRLAPGINYITLFDSGGEPLCERLLFVRPSLLPVMLSSDKKDYGKRERIRLDVNSPQLKDTAACSLAVYRLDSLQGESNASIAAYIWLEAELGSLEEAAYFLQDNSDVVEVTNDLMLTRGWRRFNWDREKARTGVARFLPEYRGQLISGRVINTTNGNLVADADCILTTPSVPFSLSLSRSDANGVVVFDVKDYYGPGDIIPQVSESNRKQYRIDILSPFSAEPAIMKLSSYKPLKTMEGLLLNRSVAMQAQSLYQADSIRRFVLPAGMDTVPFFGKPDLSYLLDNYKRFTTMEEVLREYVTKVNVVNRGGKLALSIFDEEAAQVYQDGALVILDGVLLHDYNNIFSYDPLKVKKIDIITHRYVLGSRIYSGIVSFETYDRKFDGFDLDPALVAVDYEGLQLRREFYSPDYSGGKQPRIPDFRSTLYWNPDVQLAAGKNAKLEFYSSDQKGRFAIVLQGLSSKGEPVYTTTTFTVGE